MATVLDFCDHYVTILCVGILLLKIQLILSASKFTMSHLMRCSFTIPDILLLVLHAMYLLQVFWSLPLNTSSICLAMQRMRVRVLIYSPNRPGKRLVLFWSLLARVIFPIWMEWCFMSELELTKMVSSCGSVFEVPIKLKVVLMVIFIANLELFMVGIYHLYTHNILG
jgi:hypothetical protein